MSTPLWRAIDGDRAAPAYHFGTFRAAAPAETLARVMPLMKRAGITRLADVTGLDVVGVPVFQAIRPNSRNMSLSNGKGLTRDQAKVSALMESMESFHAEEIGLPTRRATLAEIGPELDYDPYALAVVRHVAGCARRGFDYDPFLPPVGTPCFLNDRVPIDWIPATDLASGAGTWAPRELCELDYSTHERLRVPVFRATSNGLASGNTRAEALVHGLCEVIERHSALINESAWRDADRCLIPDSVDSRPVRRLLRQFARAHLKTQMIDVTSPVGVPSFEACLCDAESAAYKGWGCHPSRETALVRALTEAAQSRLGHIAGTRDDLFRETYRGGPHLPDRRPHPLFAIEPRRRFADAPDIPVVGWAALVRELAGRIRRATGMTPIAVDLTRPDFDVPVVFAIAPGLRFQPPHR
jgi:ribosomal protein S12 methylthiotransferase accessory factor